MKNKKIIAIWARVLLQELESKSEAQRKIILERAKEVLGQKKKEYLLPKILDLVIAEIAKRRQFTLTLARNQDAQTVEKIKNRLVSNFGKDKEASVIIDPEIIGGFIAKNDDYVVNASIKDYLDQLKRQYAA